MDDKRTFEAVCEALSRHGFDVAPPTAPGLHVRLLPGAGVRVGWRSPADLFGAGNPAPPSPTDGAVHTGFPGIRSALALALTEILDPARYRVDTQGAELLVTEIQCRPVPGPRSPGDSLGA